MKQLQKLLLSSAGALLVTQAVHAQPTVGNNANPGDLILGFTGGSQNFIVDLGTVGGSPVDLSSQISSSALAAAGYSTFNASVFAGVIGSDIGLDTSTYVLGSRAHNAGAPPLPPSGGNVANASGLVSGSYLGGGPGTGGSGVVTTDNTSWNQLVAINPTTAGSAQNTYVSYLGGLWNPLQAFAANGTLQEDIYKITGDSTHGLGTWIELGTLTLNFSSPSSPSITFAPTAVPEPGTYGLISGAGLLLVGLRRQLFRK